MQVITMEFWQLLKNCQIDWCEVKKLLSSNYSIIRVTLNTELDTLWFAALSSQTKALIDQLSIAYKSTDLGGCF